MARVVHLPKGSSGGGQVVDAVRPANATPSIEGPKFGGRWSGLAPDLGWARLEATDPPLVLITRLGDGAILPKQGGPVWQETDRPYRISLTDWRGYKPLAIDLPLVFDGLQTNESVEDAIAVFEAMYGRGPRRASLPDGSYAPPPLLVVHTNGVMPFDFHDAPEIQWFIDGDPTWDASKTLLNSHGNRVQAFVTVPLKQFVTDQTITDLTAEPHFPSRQGNLRIPKSYTVRVGDTLVSIASKHLGNPDLWDEIARLNQLRDPRAIKPGQKLRLR